MMNRRQRRALDAKSKGAFSDLESANNAYRILTNVLRIIESTPFAGAKTAQLVLEAYDYMQQLRSQLPKPADAPTETTGALIERVQNEINKEQSQTATEQSPMASEGGTADSASNGDDNQKAEDSSSAA